LAKQLTKRPVGSVDSPRCDGLACAAASDLICKADLPLLIVFAGKSPRLGAEIRECNGRNICISSWHDGVPVR
jgi:hypothetical protein